MNIYFLVEGRGTEKRVYPKFVEYFFNGMLTRVNQIDAVVQNNYFLLSGNGYPRIFTEVLKNTILDINQVDNYSYLIIAIDADENSIEERQQELDEYLDAFRAEGIELNDNCQLELIVQNRCIETWFLGNKKVYKANPSSKRLVEFQEFYNVKENDPELMPVFADFDNHAQFHFTYLREMLLERNIRYSKTHPRDVAEKYYLDQLIQRGQTEEAILSFMKFYNLCGKIKGELV